MTPSRRLHMRHRWPMTTARTYCPSCAWRRLPSQGSRLSVHIVGPFKSSVDTTHGGKIFTDRRGQRGPNRREDQNLLTSYASTTFPPIHMPYLNTYLRYCPLMSTMLLN